MGASLHSLFDFIRFIPHTAIHTSPIVGWLNTNNAPYGMAIMNSEDEAKLISMGMDLGVYAMSQLFATGKYQFTTRQWETFGWHAAMSLERETGKPAEDLVAAILPTIEAAMAQVFNKPNGGTPQ